MVSEGNISFYPPHSTPHTGFLFADNEIDSVRDRIGTAMSEHGDEAPGVALSGGAAVSAANLDVGAVTNAAGVPVYRWELTYIIQYVLRAHVDIRFDIYLLLRTKSYGVNARYGRGHRRANCKRVRRTAACAAGWRPTSREVSVRGLLSRKGPR